MCQAHEAYPPSLLNGHIHDRYEVSQKLNLTMYYTYVLKSIRQPGAIYIGYTSDLKSRLAEHNDAKKKSHSKRFAPGAVETYVAFTEEKDAKDFEKYLKSNSGKAFMRKRLISNQFKEALSNFNNGRNKRSSKDKWSR